MTIAAIDVGPVTDVRRLFSHPPNAHEIPFIVQSLAKTIRRYIGSSLERDGLDPSALHVGIQRGRVRLELDTADSAAYLEAIVGLLDAGRLGLKASEALHARKEWRYNWRFFLPLGLPLRQHRSVELLHFPPDYVLEEVQDYLAAYTTRRWARLLELNGVPRRETVLYQSIVDIAPISAPADEGQRLERIHGSYDAYVFALLRQWLPGPHGPRPLVAFGVPARRWIRSALGVEVKVLAAQDVEVEAGLRVPVLGANHPSFIYNLTLADDPATPEDERLAKAMEITRQDLVAAGWQVRMAAAPGTDSAKAVADAAEEWAAPERQRTICEAAQQDAFGRNAEAAATLCAKLPCHDERNKASAALLAARIEALRERLGALDGREPGCGVPLTEVDTRRVDYQSAGRAEGLLLK